MVDCLESLIVGCTFKLTSTTSIKKKPPLQKANSTQVSLTAMMIPPRAGMTILVACQITVVSDTALIMSSKSDETSLESSGLRQGVFSHFLIRGLKGEADTNGNRIISVQELYDFIGENVRTYTGMRQSPVIKGDYDGKMTVAVIR